jgi:single-stranded-DNA-specific exonuclease
MRSQWVTSTPPDSEVHDLARALGVSALLARLLVNRGVSDPGEARRFLEPRLADLLPPGGLLGMAAATERILLAIDRGERIVVWGDYDVDGVTSTTLLIAFLREVGVAAHWFVPDRLLDGYGLSEGPLRALAAEGTQLVITVDCGVSNAAEIAVARTLGMDVIVVDHHEVPAEIPIAAALIDPLQPGCPFPYKKMAACGLTFHLLVALRAALRERGWFRNGRTEPDLRDYLEIAAVGTVADVVPLTGINRILVRHGLERLERTRRPGLLALCDVSGARGKPIGVGTVAFQIGPRINAAGRLGSAAKGVELLLSESLEHAQGIARHVDDENRRRRGIEAQILEEACAQVEAAGNPESRRALVLSDRGWHPGVTGIVASKIVERYHRPTVLIAVDGDRGKGSARSISGFHLVQGLLHCAELLDNYGGHAHAAGLSIQGGRIAEFSERFERIARDRIRPSELLPRISVDGEVTLADVTQDFVTEVEQLAPFGQGNPRPVFVSRGVRVVSSRVVGGDHLQLTVEQDGAVHRAIAFRMAAALPEPGTRLDLAYHAEENHFRGRTEIQLRVRDLELA